MTGTPTPDPTEPTEPTEGELVPDEVRPRRSDAAAAAADANAADANADDGSSTDGDGGAGGDDRGAGDDDRGTSDDGIIDAEVVEAPDPEPAAHPAAPTPATSIPVAPAPVAPAWGAPPVPSVPAEPITDYTDDGVPTLAYLQDKVEKRYATALGSQELAEATIPQVADAAKRREELARSAQQRLEEIRRSLHPDAAADPETPKE